MAQEKNSTSEANSDQNKLEGIVKQLEDALENKKRELATTMGDQDELTKKLQKAHEELEKMQQSQTTQQTTQTSHSAIANKVENTLSRIELEIKEVREEIITLQQNATFEKTALQKENAELVEQLKNMEADKIKTQQEGLKLQEENSELLKQLDKLEESKVKMQQELQKVAEGKTETESGGQQQKPMTLEEKITAQKQDTTTNSGPARPSEEKITAARENFIKKFAHLYKK